MSVRAPNVSAAAAARLFSSVFVGLYSLLAARSLSPESRGQMAFVVQCGYLGGSIFLVGWERSIYAGVKESDFRNYWRKTKVWPLLAAALGLSTLFVSHRLINNLQLAPLMLASVIFPRVAEAHYIFRRRLTEVIWLELGPVALIAASYVFLQLNHSVDFRLWSILLALSTLIPTLVIMYMVPIDPLTTSSVEARHSDSNYLSLGDIGMAVTQRSDRVLMGVFQHNADLGRYSVIASLTEMTLIPVTLVSQLLSRPGGRKPFALPTFALILTFAAQVPIVLLGPRILTGLAGANYRINSGLVLLLSTGAILIGFYRIGAAALLSAHRFRLLASLEVGCGITALLLYLLLVPRWSSSGAAVATVISYGFLSVATWCAVKRQASSSARTEKTKQRERSH